MPEADPASDLAQLAEDVAGDLPAQVRKVITTALASGWVLNKPGMTLALRLSKPDDELAQPVYISWVVGRTATGRMSFRFQSCGTKGLVPLSGADLLEYLADPTVIYLTEADIEELEAKARHKAMDKPWNDRLDLYDNLKNQLGATVIKIEVDRKPRTYNRPSQATGAKPSTASVGATPLRVKIPTVSPNPQ